MTILTDIAVAEEFSKAYKKAEAQLRKDMEEAGDAIEEARDMLNMELDKKIVLDPRLDPDPYGYHSISLVDRLKAMGWP